MLEWILPSKLKKIDEYIINREYRLERFNELSYLVSAKANQIDSLLYSEKQICQSITKIITEYNILKQELEESKLYSGKIQDRKKVIVKKLCYFFNNLKNVSVQIENEIIDIQEFQINKSLVSNYTYNFHDFENRVINYNAPYTHTMMDNLIKSVNIYLIFKTNQIKSNEQSLKKYKDRILK